MCGVSSSSDNYHDSNSEIIETMARRDAIGHQPASYSHLIVRHSFCKVAGSSGAMVGRQRQEGGRLWGWKRQ